jgi:hypothetical protein
MTVTVGAGLAWLKADDFWGVACLEKSAQVLSIDTADGVFDRLDVIAVQLDKNLNTAAIVVKKGSYSPQPPSFAAPVRNLDYDEIYLASVSVVAGTTAITASDITDLRLSEEYCGVMRDGVTGIPTQSLYDTWRDWLEHLQSELSENQITNLQGQIDQNTEDIADHETKSVGGEISAHTLASGAVANVHIADTANISGAKIKPVLANSAASAALPTLEPVSLNEALSQSRAFLRYFERAGLTVATNLGSGKNIGFYKSGGIVCCQSSVQTSVAWTPSDTNGVFQTSVGYRPAIAWSGLPNVQGSNGYQYQTAMNTSGIFFIQYRIVPGSGVDRTVIPSGTWLTFNLVYVAA